MTTEKIRDTFEIIDTVERAFEEVEVFLQLDELKEAVRQAVARRLLERLRAASAPNKEGGKLENFETNEWNSRKRENKPL